MQPSDPDAVVVMVPTPAAGPQPVLLPVGRRPSPEFVLSETMRAGEPVSAVCNRLAGSLTA